LDWIGGFDARAARVTKRSGFLFLSLIHAGDAGKGAGELQEKSDPFHDQFVVLFDTLFHRIYRVLDRISGDPDLAADLAQEAFIKLYQRGFLPDSPEAWLISVAMNLFRNARTTGKRRRQLLALAFPASRDLPPAPQEGGNHSRRVRRALDQLSERDRQILLLQSDGFSYREIAAGLGLHEASIGVFLARARQAFRKLYGDADHASG
jgi:RNA polymerase sigma-70 factor (ECF subfamily)